MNLQVLQDNLGKPAGVFVPIEDWELIKINYPDVENLDKDVPQWEKDMIDSRLEAITQNPHRLKPVSGLIDELRRKI